MERQEVVQLFNDFQNYWLQTAGIQKVRESGRPIRTRKLTPDRYELFERLYDWCKEKNVDPRLWVFALFRSRRWMFAPQLLESHLMSQKFLDSGKYEKTIERGALDGYRLYAQGAKRTADPNVDIIPRAEQKKAVFRRYDQVDLCVLGAATETFGFHPKSKWCQSCPKAVECRQHVQNLVDFDIIALREGRMTVEQAKAQAHAARR